MQTQTTGPGAFAGRCSSVVPSGFTSRTIFHIDMDAFFVSVEETLDPALKGKPVIVGGDPDGRGVVAAASYEARKYGIHSAMPLARARRLCPKAIFLRGSHRRYSEFSERVFAVLDRYSPLVEPVSVDEAYLDHTGCELPHGPAPEAARRIRDAIKSAVGLNASIGIGSNKLIAKVASTCSKPNGMLWILPGRERAFLAPLSVDRIPGVGPKGGAELKRMGVKTVGDLARLPRELLEEAFGKWGTALYWKSRGVSDSEILPPGEAKSISHETTFAEDLADPRLVESALGYLCEKAASRLRETGKVARCVTLKLRFSDFKTVTRSHTLPEGTADDYDIYQTAVRLLRKLFVGRMRVRLVGVALSHLTPPGPEQSDLFATTPRENWDCLYRGIDSLRDKYGFRAILRARSSLRGR